MDIETKSGCSVFLLSPANLSGRRAKMLLNPEASFALSQELRSPSGVRLEEAFSFISSLYFRGKMTYAKTFGGASATPPGVHVISAGGGLCLLEDRVTLGRLRDWATVAIDDRNPHFTAPLVRHAAALLEVHHGDTRFVLLGSVASNKYVRPLVEVFGERLVFPTDFVGLGDMSRSALLLRAARAGQELAYSPVVGSSRSGARARRIRA